jgi:hypothetical protein
MTANYRYRSNGAAVVIGRQLRILWEEILKRRFGFEIMGEPKRLYSNFIRGFRSLPVRISCR